MWAIEDCRHLSRRFEQALVAAGERVVRVPPRMMGQAGEANASRASLIRSMPGPSLVPLSGRVLSASRPRSLTSGRWRSGCSTITASDLIAERTRQINRLRWHLVDLCPDLEAQIPARNLDSGVVLDRIARRLRSQERSARHRVALELVASIRAASPARPTVCIVSCAS